MEKLNPISEETRSISPLVAAIGNHSLYTVPHAYFDTLPVQVMLRIAIEEKSGADPNFDIGKNNVYQAPENYFEQLAGQIMQRIKTGDTHNALEELERISPLLGQAVKKNPFTTPEGYFTEFSDNIMAGVKAVDFVNEELENLSPVMAGLKTKKVYEVPEGYFSTAAAAFLEKARHQQPAKVVAIGFRKKLMRYAAAAVIAAVVATGSWMYFKPAPATDTVAGIINKVQHASDDEMLNYTETSAVGLADTDSTVVVAGDINDNDSKDLLADISDEELQKYVDQRSETPIAN